jgi:phospholipase A1
MKKLVIMLALGTLGTWTAYGDAPSALEDRIAREEKWKEDGLFILPHRPTYFMPFSYNPNPNAAPFPASTTLEDVETKYQLSFKIPLMDRLFGFAIQPVVAYTQVSYWQTYNHHNSSLFRETDYEPEFFLQFNSKHTWGPMTNRFNRVGYVHQSNGQADPNSRSWNRLYAEFFLDKGPGMISIKPWFRLTGRSSSDTNPNMEKYYGYGELRAAVKVFRSQELSLLFRNNLRSPENKGAVELGWSIPILRRVNGFVQYFNGYGESLLDYNVPASRVSVGFSFSNWL